MGTALAIGGWFAQSIIQSLIYKLKSSAFENHRLNDPAMNDALLSLNTSLSKANGILNSRHEMKAETDLNNLLNDLKEAAYDAEDLLDDLKYEELKKRVEDDEGDLSKKRKRQEIISDLLPSASKSATDLPNDATSKVREVQKRLDEITAAIEQVDSISSDVGAKEPADSYRIREESSSSSSSSSCLLDPEVFGRAEDKERLTELLLKQDEGSQSSNNVFVPVISLIGMGGIGKTTLAQWAYSELEEKFEEKIWICASNPFDVNRLTREIVQSVDKGKEYSTITNLNKLQEIVKKQLARKRFLLVIDDVWNEDQRKWEIFYAPLRLGAPGSKILVTTRSHYVAATINSKHKVLLEGLEKDEYYSFFNRCAFGYKNPKKYESLETIGRNIAVRLEGSPLAAKTLGSLLNRDLDEDHWREIQDSKIWNLPQGDNDMMPVLKRSFDNLSPYLKPCFAYCSLFPKNYVFDQDNMVQLWMAQDFIGPEENLQMEDIGSRYFDDLLSRGFFQKLPNDEGFVMHDLLHDLAQYVSEDKCVRLECGRPQDIPSTVRHLSVCVPYPELAISDICKHKKLWSLLFVNNNRRTCDVEFSVQLEDLLTDLTCLRTLKLRGFLDTLPDCIGKLKQLRYLDISYTEIHKLPESLGLLYNLQILKVDPYMPMFYPKTVGNLVNLRNVPSSEFVEQVADIGKLSSLQKLDYFNTEEDHVCKIEELQKLNDLGGELYIEHLESINTKEEASKAKLKDKKYLRELSLEWTSDRRTNLRIHVSDTEVLEGLQPHSNLEVLKIKSYCGLRYPSWLESQLLSNLITIRLIDCKNMEQLPPLGQLPFLKILHLEGLNSVKKVGEEFYGTTESNAFPLLEELEINNMPGFEEYWSPGCSGELFPCLRDILIENCPKLKVLACLPPTVICLSMIEVGLDAFPPLGHLSSLKALLYGRMAAVRKVEDLFGTSDGLSSLQLLEFVDMPELEEWSEVYGGQFFPCLSRLDIKHCPKLRNLPCLPPSLVTLELCDVGLDALPGLWVSKYSSSSSSSYQSTSLSKLHIESCPRLNRLDEWLKDFACLQILTLRDSPKLISAVQVDWVKVAHIPNIDIDGKWIIDRQLSDESRTKEESSDKLSM